MKPDEADVERVAKAICAAAKTWKPSEIWPEAAKGKKSAVRIVERYREEARAAIKAMRS